MRVRVLRRIAVVVRAMGREAVVGKAEEVFRHSHHDPLFVHPETLTTSATICVTRLRSFS